MMILMEMIIDYSALQFQALDYPKIKGNKKAKKNRALLHRNQSIKRREINLGGLHCVNIHFHETRSLIFY